jgi:hypothetical protein
MPATNFDFDSCSWEDLTSVGFFYKAQNTLPSVSSITGAPSRVAAFPCVWSVTRFPIWDFWVLFSISPGWCCELRSSIPGPFSHPMGLSPSCGARVVLSIGFAKRILQLRAEGSLVLCRYL